MQKSNDELYLSDEEQGPRKMSISAESNFSGYNFPYMADEESTRSDSPTSVLALPESPPATKKSDKTKLNHSSAFFNSKKRDNAEHVEKAEVKPAMVAENSETEQQPTKDKGRKKLRQALSGSQESFASVSTLEDLGSFHL